MLILKDAPFDRKDADLVPSAGSCVDCPKRTGHNKLLFAGISDHADACSDPACWSVKLEAHVKKTIAAKPKLVQISTAFAKPAEGSPLVPRNRYVEIRQEKPKNKYQQDAPEFKTCKYTTEAIVADGAEKGEIRKVCVSPDCAVHHPKKQYQRTNGDAAFKAQQEKQRREEAIANATGIRVLAAISAAVPVRLMKRDLLFVTERLAALLDESRLADRCPSPWHQTRKRHAIQLPSCLARTSPSRGERVWQRLGGTDHRARGIAPASGTGVEGCCRRIQGGYRCYRCQGQAGVRGERQG